MTGQSGSGGTNGTATSTPFPSGNETAVDVPPLPPELTDPIHATFPTLQAQLAGTFIAALVLLFLGELIRSAGGSLKERFNDTAVEAAQAGTMAVFTAFVGVFFVVVWRGSTVIQYAFGTLRLREGDVARAMFTVVILAGAYTFTRITKRAVKRAGKRRGTISRHQRQIGHHIAQVSIYSVALMLVLGLWGVNVGGLLVGAGFAGIVLGLAARQTLGAVLAGFVVLFSRPFELGDWVRIGDQEGVVTDINIVNTQLRTFDDEFLMVPNDTVTSEEILNRSRKGRLRINVDVGVDYETDIETAIDLAEGAMAEQDLVLDQPTPHVVLPEFDDSAVVLRLRFHIDNPSARKMWRARTNVIAAVKSAFAEGGVVIPFPQRELSARGADSRFDVPAAPGRDGASNGADAAETNGSPEEGERSDGSGKAVSDDQATGSDDAE
ncbi:mechanosensitive ion channel family protein [Halorarum halobium]|uniref:mechanosensitive ion channel family protein n=1 Tax=Halorarum halobium TaxID=3075121 RepID=UPI0028AC2328|nr:mechanosensitive ion channel family protein [Halobaculum sp. XH14]